MVTETNQSQSKPTVRSESREEPISLLTAELVDELRKRVEEPASTPTYDNRQTLAMKLWKYVTTADA